LTERRIYYGSLGPFFYEDTDTYPTPDAAADQGFGDGATMNGVLTDGSLVMASVKLFDTNASNTLEIKWNENDTGDRILNLLVGGGDRSLTLNENFTIGDGTNITITGVTAARTITLNENFTIGDGTDITITGVTAARTFTMNENFVIGNGNDGTLTYSGASKVLTVEDSAIVSQDYTSDSATVTLAKLTLTSTQAQLLDLNPGVVGTAAIIDITPSAVISTVDAEWDGINIDGDILDPSAAGVYIHGMHIDLSTVGVGSVPAIDGLHIEVPKTSHIERVHALHANHGIYLESDVTTFVAGLTGTTVDVLYDTTGASGGCVHALDVARAGGGTISTVAVGTHTNIDVIHQHIGTATALDKVWEWEAGPTWTDVTSSCAGTDGDAAIWEAQNDVMYFGHSTTFDELICVFATPATKHMHFTFWFSTGASTYTQFYPGDDTNGAQVTGAFRWLASDLSTWATGTVNTTTTKYWIKIIRTRLVGTGPTEDTIKYIEATQYSWDKLGAITALSLSVGTIGCGTITVADGSSISLQEDITFTGATTENLIKFPDNLADALSFKNANGDSFLQITSTTGSFGISGGLVKDEDNMASDSAVHLCSQQSIKAYTDAAGGTAFAVAAVLGTL